MKQIIKFFKWVKFIFWTKPVQKPPKEKPIRVMGEQVFNDYVVIEYNGQKINLRINQLQLWNAMNRKDKRGMAKRFEIQEKKGLIRFELINGKWICVKNKNYEKRKDGN